MQAVIISFQSLAANCLGCYGNDWIETPNWDRFASSGAVFDRHFADIVDLHESGSATQNVPSGVGPGSSGLAWATGCHAVTESTSVARMPIGRRLRSHGICTRLITAGKSAVWQDLAEFDRVESVALDPSPDPLPDQVPFARVVKAGIAAWKDPSTRNSPRLIWLHTPGPGRPPKGFDSLYIEDFEERGIDFSKLTDDDRAAHPALYGGAVSLLDHWLGEFLKEIYTDQEPTLVVITAAQGQLWQQVKRPTPRADICDELCDQRVQAPLSLQVTSDSRSSLLRSLRSNRLVQTCDLVPTLADWFGLPDVADEPPLIGRSWLRELMDELPPREFLRVGNGHGVDAIRTSEWLCICRRPSNVQTKSSDLPSQGEVSLFQKPEDFWDVNDVAAQYPQTVDELQKNLCAMDG